MNENEIATLVIDASIKVHKTLGPGLLESVYQYCLEHELKSMGLMLECEKPLPIIYNDVKLDKGFKIDLLVEKKLLVELKSVEALHDLHLAQTLTYLRLSGLKLGLLINFNSPKLMQGLRRVINGTL